MRDQGTIRNTVALVLSVSAVAILPPQPGLAGGPAASATSVEADTGSGGPAPAPSPSADGLDTDFLLLPAYDLERIFPTPAPSFRSSSPAGEPEREVRVGDRIPVLAKGIRLPPGVRADAVGIKLPRGDSPLVDQGWDILSPRGARGAGENTADLSFTAVPLKPGDLTFPSLAVTEPGSGRPIARTQPLHLRVESAIRKDDPHPREPVAPLPPENLAFPWWLVEIVTALGAAAACGLAYLLWRWLRERRRARSADGPFQPLAEDQEALAGLLELEGSGALQSVDFKVLHHRVSEILKTYVGKRYGFDALDRTTREMLEELARIGGTEASLSAHDRLAGLFTRLDRVKFTDFRPAESEARALIEEARGFVRETRRRTDGPVLAPSTLAVEGGP